MQQIHILNVGEGSCVLIQSGSGHWTMFDICKGNQKIENSFSENHGNFRMAYHPENPIAYCNKLGINTLFRFILSHPDMDHMDGLAELIKNIDVINFWDSGVRKEKSDFKNQTKYKEEDWDIYDSIINNNESIKVVSPMAGHKNKYFNIDDVGSGGDYIHIFAPNHKLVAEANESGDPHTGSYVLAYRSAGGRILLCGDAHDATWEFVLANYPEDLKDCELMVAPHHGRDSDRSYDFLDELMPQFTVMGYAKSEYLAYDAWNNRGLDKITQNQAGNIVIYPSQGQLDVYVESEAFAKQNCRFSIKDIYGNFFYTRIDSSKT